MSAAKTPLQAVVGVLCDALCELPLDDQVRALEAVRVTLDLRASIQARDPAPALSGQEELIRTQRELRSTEGRLDEWRSAHRELATLLGARARGRDHCDSILIIAAIKRAFHITHLAVVRAEGHTAEIHVTTDDNIHRVLITEETIG